MDADEDPTSNSSASTSRSSSLSLSLNFSVGSTHDYEENDDGTYNAPQPQPYRFQPVLAEGEIGGDGATAAREEDDQQWRLESLTWCSCFQCSGKATAAECRCCQEIPEVRELIGTSEAPTDCITQHPGFRSVCLDTYVLDTAYYGYRQTYGDLDLELHERYRYTAYRQLVRWCWGYLGRNVRVPLPSCAVDAIRAKFPNTNGDPVYTGFIAASD